MIQTERREKAKVSCLHLARETLILMHIQFLSEDDVMHSMGS